MKTGRFRKTMLIISVFVMLITGLTACAGPRNDQQFIKNMQSALEKRWDASDASNGKQYASDKEYKDDIKKLINIEVKALGELDTYTFEDGELAGLAQRYYDALKNQDEGIKYYNVSDADYYDQFTLKGYNERASVVYILNRDYGLEVGEKHESIMDEFCVIGKKMGDLTAAVESLSQTVPELVFDGNNRYDLNIENTSGFDLDNVNITVNGYNGDTVVCTGNGYLPEWGTGEKNSLSIYMNKEFEKATLAIEFSDYNGFEGKTGEMALTVKNDLIINIEMPKFPSAEISTSFGSEVYTKCIAEDVQFEVSYWNDGKAGCKLFFSGLKTYDKEGADYSRNCEIGWKLYDMDGTVVDSGVCYTSDARMGESFKDCEEYINAGLAPGDYRLELLNVD